MTAYSKKGVNQNDINVVVDDKMVKVKKVCNSNKTSLNGVKIARISTVPFFVVTQLKKQIEFLIDCGAIVTVITSSGPEISQLQKIPNIKLIIVDIPREISILRNFMAFIRLLRIFNGERFDVVHSTTPMAGLLTAVAAYMVNTPIRLHTFTGQPWVEVGFLKGILLKLADKCIGIFNTACYADSVSQKEFLVLKKIINPSKISVLGKGSLAGVDVQRFNPGEFSEVERSMIRQSLQIPVNSIVLLFVGRIVKDKGVIELVKAFKDTFANDPNVYFIFVGPQELSLSDLGIDTDTALKNRIKFTGYTDTPERYMSISKVLCIPSYREGFGTVVIEAAAMGVPAIGSNIYGLSDSIIHGETGLLVKPKHSVELAKALHNLVYNTELCYQLGQSAQRRVLKYFSSTIVNQKIIHEYEFLLLKKNISELKRRNT